MRRRQSAAKAARAKPAPIPSMPQGLPGVVGKQVGGVPLDQQQGLWFAFKLLFEGAFTQCLSMWRVLRHTFRKRSVINYPEQAVALPPRYRGRIVLTRDPSGEERCVACNLCAVACPVGCISLQKTEREDDGRWYPEWFRINFSRCIYCGMCEEACPTYAIQLIPDFEMAEYDRSNMVYEKEHLLISGQGKRPGYSFYQVSGLAIDGKPKGAADHETPPVDTRSLLP